MHMASGPNAFYNGYSGYGQDPAYDYGADNLNLAPNQSSALNPAWPGNLQHHVQSPLSTVHDGQYGQSYANTPVSLHESSYGSPANTHSFSGVPYPALPSMSGMETSNMVGSAGYAGTIQPHVLQTNFSPHSTRPIATPPRQGNGLTRPAPIQSNAFSVPKGEALNKFSVISTASLEAATRSRRLHHWIHIGDDAQDVIITKSTIPVYHPRKSRNEIRRLLSTDGRLAAKLSKKSSKKAIAPSKSLIKGVEALGPRGPPALKTATSPSSSEESTDDESASEESEEEMVPSPLPETRPTVALEAVRYDSVKALWRPTNRSATAEEIRGGLKGYWEVVQTIRDRWKSDVAAVKQAEETKKIGEVPLLKERVQTQRTMLEAALKAAIEFGHPDIVEHLGEILPFLLCLAQFLQDRARDTDYNGSLSQAILELLSKCKTLTDSTLEKTGVGKVSPRFLKKGDAKTQSFVKLISSNAAAAVKKRKELTKASVSGSPQTKDTKSLTDSSPKAAAPSAGIKRPRPIDVTIDQPQKKVAGEAPRAVSGSSTVSNGPARVLNSAAKRPSTTSTESKSSGSTVATGKPKVQQAAVKPSGFFSSLQSAAKKPGTSNAALAQAKANTQSATTDKKPVSSAAPAAAPPRPSFSFSDTLASLHKPKEPEAHSKPEESHPPESEEEKKKRLRKEERRKLRVTFKPDSVLIDVRYFTYDPDEEIGHDANMVRDVGDVGSEGRMLKLHADMMDIDEEEDDSSAPGAQTSAREYTTPSLIDFSVIEADQRSANYEPYGGGTLKPDSSERLAQEHREANSLMVFYSNSADIPPCPKEPSEPYSGPEATQLDFGPPPEIVLSRIARFQESRKQSQNPSISPTENLASMLSAISSQPPSQQSQLQMLQTQQSSGQTSELEKIFASFAAQGQQQQAQQAPQPQTFHQQQPEQKPDFQAILASIIPQNQTQQVQGFRPPQPPDASTVSQDISSILASLGQGQGQGQPQMPGIPLSPGFPFMPPQQQPQQQQQQQSSGFPYENEERRRWREQGGADIDQLDGTGAWNQQQQQHQSKQQQQQQQGKGWTRDKKGNREPPKFVVQCKYWKEGKCRKGSECTFLHE